MRIERARMYYPASLELDEAGIRELEQMLDLGDATAEGPFEPANHWHTHIVRTAYSDGRCFREYFVRAEGREG